MTKKEIREIMKSQKEQLTTLDICRESRPVIDSVIASEEFAEAKAIYIYMEYNQEIITHAIMTKAWEMGKKVAVPKVFNKTMDFYYIESFDDVIPGYMGILEPVEYFKAEEESALVIMPGIAFDRDFNRIGYGGGFYDGFFATHRNTRFTKMGLCYDFQIIDHIESEPHDYKVDLIITPNNIYRKCYNQSTSLLKNIDLFVLDMDGTFYLSNDIIDGSNDFLRMVEKCGKRWMFFTNNSSRDKKLYIQKLAAMDCPITSNDILTSGDITIEFLKKNRPGKSVFLLGTPPLAESFVNAGIELHQDLKDEADIVVVAFDMSLTYDKLEHACTLIRNGAEYIATHPDINCPTSTGFIPDCGAFIAAINLSTGCTPQILGKPYKETVDMISQVSGVSPDRIAFVGDRLYTDIACGVNNNSHGILVLSGETKAEDIAKSIVKPDLVFERIFNIGETLIAECK